VELSTVPAFSARTILSIVSGSGDFWITGIRMSFGALSNLNTKPLNEMYKLRNERQKLSVGSGELR
jgi:hypothetical protein